ncbi:achaete-scute complex protein T3 [Rhipicephalus sanguineus]|uniref:BHLH domain-containing protein n=1 Tax=Rhipicephalus sanguineus TaxID=34632 RepID=A0A9D4PDY0_RHISA|nr:achaete-scute complex protein T3 [Rhipicephalus sanguineus]KAH7939206.1 hypothetical protein HPB52_008500 [Rhipicephalus sanguineus]
MSSYRMIRSASSATHHNGHPQHYKASEVLRFARRTPYHHHQPVISSGYSQAVARRNERERNRVRLVNMGFAALRQHVPNFTQNKKMSKVDTLRSAVDYIKALQELLDRGAGQQRHSNSERDIEDDDTDETSYKANHERRHGMTSFEDADAFYDFSRIGEDNAPSSPAVVLQPSEMSESSASALDCYGADDAELMDFCQPWLV